MHPLHEREVNALFNVLDRLGDNGIAVLSHSTMNDLKTGSLRKPSGIVLEVKLYTKNDLHKMATENDVLLLNRVNKWFIEGRLAGMDQSGGKMAFRYDIAQKIGENEFSYHVKGKDIQQDKALATSITGDDYDEAKDAVLSLIESLEAVKIEPSEKRSQKERLKAPAPPLTMKEGAERAQRRPDRKAEDKKWQKAAITHQRDLQRQEKANKKRREEEKKRIHKHNVKVERSRENLEFDLQERRIKEDDRKKAGG
jgi:hypothetical protein